MPHLSAPLSAPPKKGELLAIAEHVIHGVPHSQIPALAKRHKIDSESLTVSGQEARSKQAGKSDEAELSKQLLEISLLDGAYHRASSSHDPLMDAASAIGWIPKR